jgi:hypothetical protein
MLMGFINQLIIHFIYDGPTMTGWWYTYPSEKYESVGMMTFPTEWTNKNMFQNNNKIYSKLIHVLES